MISTAFEVNKVTFSLCRCQSLPGLLHQWHDGGFQSVKSTTAHVRDYIFYVNYVHFSLQSSSKMKIPLLSVLLFSLVINSMAQDARIAQLTRSVEKFVDQLSPDQKKMAFYEFSSEEREKWTNLPVGMAPRPGINIGRLTNDQRKSLHRILYAAFSSQGYLKTTSILSLDNLLNSYYDSLLATNKIQKPQYDRMMNFNWSHKNFYLSLFGTIGTKEPWGLKFTGHHLSINLTFVNNVFSVTPFFIGTDPAEFPLSEYAGLRVLGKEEDYGLLLINMLNESQKKTATSEKNAPGDIFTSPESKLRLLDYWGIKASEFTPEQKNMLTNIIREYVYNLERDKADMEYDKILKAGVENIYFGWMGSYEEKKRHYFVVNGPTFLIEFDNNNGNHIHTIWRTKGNDFGEDVLKQHYLTSEHK